MLIIKGVLAIVIVVAIYCLVVTLWERLSD